MEKLFFSNYSPDDMRNIIKEVVREALHEFNQIKSAQEVINGELLTRKEAMELLRVKSTKFNELRNEGFVHPVRIGKKTLYRKSDLIDYYESLMS